MVWVLMWIQSLSGSSLDYIHLSTYYREADCIEQLQKAEVMKVHKGVAISCIEIDLEGIKADVRDSY